jgi:hypothetical protein
VFTEVSYIKYSVVRHIPYSQLTISDPWNGNRDGDTYKPVESQAKSECLHLSDRNINKISDYCTNFCYLGDNDFCFVGYATDDCHEEVQHDDWDAAPEGMCHDSDSFPLC